MNGKTEYPKGELFTIDLKKGDERVEFGFGLIINGRNYLEIVRIIPDSDAARSPLKIRDILLTIGGEEIFKKGKEVYYAAIHKIAEGAVATMRFCHPLLYTTIENLSEQQTSSYFERLKSAVDNDDPSAMQTVNNSLYEYHIQLMNSDVVWPLHRAIMGNHVKVAEILTSNYGILDLDAFSETYKGTTLTLAARSGQYDIVEKLLSSGAYSSHPLSLSWNPLRIAIQSGHDEVALLLAEKHRDLQSAKTVAYKCLIHLAVANGRLNLLDRWWKEGMNPNQSMPEDLSSDSDFSPSHTLATALTKYEASQNDDEKEGRRKIVAFLLDKGASIDDEIMRSCFTAVTSYMNWQKGANSWTIVNLSNVKTIDFKRWLTPENGSLTALDLSNSLIKTLPSSVPWDFPNIRAFVMNNCKELTELSESKDAKPSCKKLTTVSLCYNPKLTTLPLNYFRLKNLTELKVMQCALSFLPWSNDNLVEDTK
uniref:PDZ domain-containing protein n=1 Tax=Plectus sambesii TaxID=2011161 RepID=A0A914WLL1_9BILA